MPCATKRGATKMPRLKKGSPEAKAHMAKIRKKAGKGAKAKDEKKKKSRAAALPYEVKGKAKDKAVGKATEMIEGYGEYGTPPEAPKKKRRKRAAKK